MSAANKISITRQIRREQGSVLIILLVMNLLIASMLSTIFWGENLFAKRTAAKSTMVRKLKLENAQLEKGLEQLSKGENLAKELSLRPYLVHPELQLLEFPEMVGNGLLLWNSGNRFFPNWENLLIQASPCFNSRLEKSLQPGASAVSCKLGSQVIGEAYSASYNIEAKHLRLATSANNRITLSARGEIIVEVLTLELLDNSKLEIIARGSVRIRRISMPHSSRSIYLRIYSQLGEVEIKEENPSLNFCPGKGGGQAKQGGQIFISLESSRGVTIAEKMIGASAGCSISRDSKVWSKLWVRGRTRLL